MTHFHAFCAHFRVSREPFIAVSKFSKVTVPSLSLACRRPSTLPAGRLSQPVAGGYWADHRTCWMCRHRTTVGLPFIARIIRVSSEPVSQWARPGWALRQSDAALQTNTMVWTRWASIDLSGLDDA